MTTDFTAKDAQAIVTLVQKRLPLQNLDEAAVIADLMNRFSAWANEKFPPPSLPPAPPAPPAPPPPPGPLGKPLGFGDP